MRHILFYISIISSLLAGCSGEPPADARLLQAERTVDHQPYKALKLLTPVAADSLPTAADSALFFLLWGETMHNLNLTARQDDALDYAVGYYEHVGDQPRLARALLHRGMVLYERQDYAAAIQLVKHAERLAADVHDAALTYAVCNVLADINDNAANLPLAITYYRRALDAALHTADTVWQVRAMNNLATTFDRAGLVDSLRRYSEMSRPLRSHINGMVLATTLTNQAALMLHDGHRRDARRLLETLQQGSATTERATMLLADLMADDGETERATQLWYSLLFSNVPDIRIHCYEQLIAHFSRRGDAHRCNDLYQRLNRYYQHTYAEGTSADIVAWQTQIDRQQHEQHQYRTLIALLLAVIGLLAVIIAFGWYHRRRVRRLNDRIEQLNQRYLSWHMAESLLAAEPVSALHRLATRGRPATDDDWRRLHELVQQQSPDLLARLHATGALSPREVNLCLLIRLRFVPSEMGTLMGLSPQTVTNMRVRLLQKIFGLRGGARDFDSRMRDM